MLLIFNRSYKKQQKIKKKLCGNKLYEEKLATTLKETIVKISSITGKKASLQANSLQVTLKFTMTSIIDI